MKQAANRPRGPDPIVVLDSGSHINGRGERPRRAKASPRSVQTRSYTPVGRRFASCWSQKRMPLPANGSSLNLGIT